jgi:pyridoxamine 5'-phosphate oxidase
MNLADLRLSYRDAPLTLDDLDPDPVRQFQAWLGAAVDARLPEPNAMSLGTVDADGAPSVRMVLLKGLDAGRFTFFTNFESRKAAALAAEARCGLCFWWGGLERQVRVEGRAEPLDDAAADAYFATRPRDSQLGAWASPQGQPLDDRSLLEARHADAATRFPDQVPRPAYWGGYAVTPSAIEFWQGRASRLHDRIAYTLQADGSWMRTRLSP